MGGSSSTILGLADETPAPVNVNQGTLVEHTNQLDEPENWIFSIDGQSIKFRVEEIIGKGTFGTVYRAKNLETQQTVAIKRTRVAEEHESIEPSMLNAFRHRNVVALKHAFSTPLSDHESELFIITEYVSSDLNRILHYYRRMRTRMMDDYIMVYMYQLLKGLEFIHRESVAHRDLKPSNILVSLENHALKICDFGSARVMNNDRKNATYICSRYYRAPELLMGCRHYNTAVDIWSCGCILAELYLGKAIFMAEGKKDQLTEIEALLGTPTEKDLEDLGKCKRPISLRKLYPRPWSGIFHESVCDQAIDLISRMVMYSPKKRIHATTALGHPFFDPIRKIGFTLPLGVLPTLFDSEEEREVRRST